MIRVREMDIEFYRHYYNSLGSGQGPPWRYNEMKPCGVNFDNFILAGRYDAFHQSFRDYRQETERIIAALGLNRSTTVLDIGCGTGAFAIHAAARCRKIYAVDIAEAMLRRARRKAKRAGLTNVEFRRGGLLSYEHEDGPVDAIVSTAALHHLPDFWKLVALHRLASMLAPGGRLYLFDVVFSFDAAQYRSRIERYVGGAGVDMGPNGRAALETHVREEYSTCDWIMEGLLQRAGFRIDDANYIDDFLAGYVCTKQDRPLTSS
jgi:putative AdoMet-dependent methyltransferase